MPKTELLNLNRLITDFPQFTFEEHEVFHWSPRHTTVYYNSAKLERPEGIFQLLHELSHALLDHIYYESGIELLRMGAAAWEKARELAKRYDIKISSKHVERCLDSYRDWLHLRSTCPNCKSISLEVSPNSYHCFNCSQRWNVPKDQRSRRYRLKQVQNI